MKGSLYYCIKPGGKGQLIKTVHLPVTSQAVSNGEGSCQHRQCRWDSFSVAIAFIINVSCQNGQLQLSITLKFSSDLDNLPNGTRVFWGRLSNPIYYITVNKSLVNCGEP